jgi:hypothetical protein
MQQNARLSSPGSTLWPSLFTLVVAISSTPPCRTSAQKTTRGLATDAGAVLGGGTSTSPVCVAVEGVEVGVRYGQ